jgi:hypothetical protein
VQQLSDLQHRTMTVMALQDIDSAT